MQPFLDFFKHIKLWWCIDTSKKLINIVKNVESTLENNKDKKLAVHCCERSIDPSNAAATKTNLGNAMATKKAAMPKPQPTNLGDAMATKIYNDEAPWLTSRT